MSRLSHHRLAPWKLLLRTHAVVLAKLEHHLQIEHGVPLSWFDVLAQLSLAGGQLRMTELAQAVLLTTSGLTRLLDRMERAGLILRQPCEDDRRGQWAILTEEGQQTLARTTPGHLRQVARHFLAHLDQDDIGALSRILSKVLAAEDQKSHPHGAADSPQSQTRSGATSKKSQA